MNPYFGTIPKENRKRKWIFLRSLTEIIDALVPLVTFGYCYSSFTIRVLTAQIRTRK